MRFRRTTGVRPTVPRMLSWIMAGLMGSRGCERIDDAPLSNRDPYPRRLISLPGVRRYDNKRGSAHRLQPAVLVRGAALEQAEEQLLHAPGHGSWLAGAHGFAVHRADGGDLGSGTAHEDLVREVEVLARQVPLHHLDAGLACERDDAVARDAVQDGGARGRGVQRALEGEEQVLAGALGEEAGGGERDALAVA